MGAKGFRVFMLGLLTFLPPMSLHLVPSREACIAFVNKAVNSDNIIAPIRIHIIPNARPQRVLGVLSPYLMRKRNQITLRFEDSVVSIKILNVYLIDHFPDEAFQDQYKLMNL